MPLNKKGKKIMKSMKKQYGEKRGETVFYASKNKGVIKGVEKAKKRSKNAKTRYCLLYTSPSPRDRTRSRMPSSA